MPQSSLLQLGKIVAKDMARGGPSPGLQDLGEALASRPDSVMDVLELLFAEVRKKRPNAGLISAFLFMLRQALEATRWRNENQPSAPNDLIDRVRASIALAAANDRLPPELLLMLAQCFAAAKLDIGDELRNTIGASALHSPPGAKTVSGIGDFEAQLGKIAAGLDHDPFLIQTHMAESLAGFPVDRRIEMISMLALSGVPSLREAALGWLLDPEITIANAVAGILAQIAGMGLVSAAGLNRMITIRNWVGAGRRPAVDAAIRAARQHDGAAAPLPSVQVGDILASSCDGAGAQSYFVLSKQKRKISVASLLIKHGFGIRDAWVGHGKSRGEVAEMVNHIHSEVGGWNASLDGMQTALSHGLAINARTNEPIPFALLQFIEVTGLPPMTPAYLDPDQLIGRLLDEIPADNKNENAISRALAGSKRWLDEFVWLDSWFDDSEAASKAARREKTIKARTEAVLNSVVAERRKHWAELLAWNALAARDDGDTGEWIGFTLVARELLGDRPIREIPLAIAIARNSIAAIDSRL